MLRKTRIFLATLFLIGITLLFIGIGHGWWDASIVLLSAHWVYSRIL